MRLKKWSLLGEGGSDREQGLKQQACSVQMGMRLKRWPGADFVGPCTACKRRPLEMIKLEG